MESELENLCADAGYTGEAPCKAMVEAGYGPHVRLRVQNSGRSWKTRLPKRVDGSLKAAILGSTGSVSWRLAMINLRQPI